MPVTQKCLAHLLERKPEIAYLKNLGERLLRLDPKEQATIQDSLESLDHHAKDTQETVDDTVKKLESAADLWSELDRCRTPFADGIGKVAMVTEQPIKCSSKEEVEELLQHHQVRRKCVSGSLLSLMTTVNCGDYQNKKTPNERISNLALYKVIYCGVAK